MALNSETYRALRAIGPYAAGRELATRIGQLASAATGSLKDSDGSNIKCDKYFEVTDGSSTYYVACYDTLNS